MAKPTERSLKRKPMAVILLTCERGKVPEVPPEGREFEWFTSEDGRKTYFDKNAAWHKEDTEKHDDMAYLAVEITDTATMKVGRIDAQPADNDEVKAWAAAVKKDITLAFTPVKPTESKSEEAAKKVVRPRRKSTAAAAVKKDEDSKAKAARVKKRLADKKAVSDEKKSETGDAPPKQKAAAGKS